VISFGIRLARLSEARLLGELAVRSKAVWGYTSEFLDLCRDELSVADADVTAGNVFVLEEADRVVGFHSLEHVADGTVELAHLFLEPDTRCAGRLPERSKRSGAIRARSRHQHARARDQRRRAD